VTVARRTALFAALALAWAGVIFAVSSLSDPFPFVPRGLLSQDKLIHAAVYGLLGAFVRVALAGTRLRPGAALLVALALAAVYGASDELHQMYVPNREPSTLDLVADAVGALLGAAVAGVALRRQGRGASIAA
jgi:VanZ family protein